MSRTDNGPARHNAPYIEILCLAGVIRVPSLAKDLAKAGGAAIFTNPDCSAIAESLCNDPSPDLDLAPDDLLADISESIGLFERVDHGAAWIRHLIDTLSREQSARVLASTLLWGALALQSGSSPTHVYREVRQALLSARERGAA